MQEPVTFTFRMPKPLRDQAAAEAAKDRSSLNAWILRLIDAEIARRERLERRETASAGAS